MPPSSRASATTVKTVDDVMERMSAYEGKHGELSYHDAVDYVKKICGKDDKLLRETVSSLKDPSVYLSVVCSDARKLLKLMSQYGVILGGIQATSFFYPIAEITSAPWDFYCDKSIYDPTSFIEKFRQITMMDMIEDVDSDDGQRVVYFRGNVNEVPDPINIRIYVSDKNVYASVLDTQKSYQQSFISPIGAVCFWPKLGSARQYRSFDKNDGLKAYPRGNTKLRIGIKSMTEVKPKIKSNLPSIYTMHDKRATSVIYENDIGIDQRAFDKLVKELKGIVYSVHTSSSRYLGTIGNMS